MENNITNKDKGIIRDLAKKQYEYSQLEVMKQRANEWLLHNTFKGERPMIHLELWTFEQEIIPQLLKCESIDGRNIESSIYRNFLNYEMFNDDMIVPDYYGIGWNTYFTLFNTPITSEHASGANGNSLGHQFNYVIKDLEEDFPKLKKTVFGVNKEQTIRRKNYFEELLGDILPVKLTMRALSSVPTQDIVHLMGMENMFVSMYDCPDTFHAFINHITEDYLSYFKFLEDENLIMPTVGREGLDQGSLCYTDELPGYDIYSTRKFTTKDVWGFMDSQETVGISPAMYEEFIFPYYKKVAKQYGLLSYGCCEPVDPIWDNCLSKLDNLRKISISPWCNEEFMADKLRGKKIIYHRKPSPNYLGVGKNLDETAFKAHIVKTLKVARGCKLEITQRDVYTLDGNINKAKRYVEIIRQAIEEYWKS